MLLVCKLLSKYSIRCHGRINSCGERKSRKNDRAPSGSPATTGIFWISSCQLNNNYVDARKFWDSLHSDAEYRNGEGRRTYFGPHILNAL